MTPVLHDYWRSSASYRVRIALALKGIAYEARPVDLLKGEQRGSDNLQRNPQGQVPTLEIDGLVLTQSLAIMEYLEETRPEVPILPRQAAARAQARAIAAAVACDIHPLSNPKVLSRVEALGGKDARAHWNRDNIRTGLQAVEQMLVRVGSSAQFCVGDAPSIADCALIPQVYNARRWQVDITDLPRIVAVDAACAGLPAFQAAAPRAPKPPLQTAAE